MKRQLVTCHQPHTTKRAAFALIELLVVISVIALLLALLMPALQRARNQARKVMCRSNLRQFGSALNAHVEDNEGHLPVRGAFGPMWLLRGSSPGQDPNVPELSKSVRMARAALCPMAVKPANRPGTTPGRHGQFLYWGGSTFRAWTSISPGPVFHASYGFNLWPFRSLHSENNSGFFPGQSGVRGRRGLNVFTVASKSRVPILLDSRGPGRWPRAALGPAWSQMVGLINRHNGRVNGLFLDWSVREVGLKELWTLKWCPNFDTAGPWTRAGGVRPEAWPEWMRGFEDY